MGTLHVTLTDGNELDEVLSMSCKIFIDLCNPLNLGSNDEFSFDESIEFNYATEQEELERNDESIKDIIEFVIKTIENENVSVNLVNEEPQ